MKALGDIFANWITNGEQPSEQDVEMVKFLLNSMQLNNFPAQNWPTIGRVDFNDITANTASKNTLTDTNNPTGFVDRTKSTLALSTRTLTITPTGASYDIYSAGTKITKTAAESTTIANTVGLHYVYFTSSGVLSNSMTAWDIEGTGIPVCTIYWNGSAGAIGEERHSAKRNNVWHKWAHDTIGTRYESGLGITYPSGAQPARTQIELGYIHDEDLDISIAQQKLVRIFYETASAVWTWVNGTDNSGYDRPYIWNAGTSRLQYPKSNASYTLTDVDANKYIVMWVYATSDIDRPIYIVVKSATSPYNSAALARAETTPIVINILAPEMKLIYRLIYAGDGTFSEATDYRTSSPLPGGAIGTLPATQVSFAPTSDIVATNVQAAIEETYSEAAGVAIPKSILSAKGSLISASAASTPSELTAGTNFFSPVWHDGEANGIFAKAVPVCLYSDATEISVSNTTTETEIITQTTIPANWLSSKNWIEIFFEGLLYNNKGTDGTLTFKIYYGSNNSSIGWTIPTGGTYYTRFEYWFIRADGGLSSQRINNHYVSVPSSGVAGVAGVYDSTIATDATQNQTLKVTVTLNAASASFFFKNRIGHVLFHGSTE